MNLLKLINPSLAHVYCSNLVCNHSLIRLIRFVSQFISKLCNSFFISSRFNTSNLQRLYFKNFMGTTKRGPNMAEIMLFCVAALDSQIGLNHVFLCCQTCFSKCNMTCLMVRGITVHIQAFPDLFEVEMILYELLLANVHRIVMVHNKDIVFQ